MGALPLKGLAQSGKPANAGFLVLLADYKVKKYDLG